MDFHHLSLIASDITAKLEQQQKELDLEDWPISLHKPNLIHWTDNSSSLNTDDNFRSGCQNLSHCNWRQFFSGIPPLDIQTHYHNFIIVRNVQSITLWFTWERTITLSQK